MRANTTKKIVLGFLSVALLYVWYGNFQMFWGGDDAPSPTVNAHGQTSATPSYTYSKQRLDDIAPKLNPFAEQVSNKQGTVDQSSAPPPSAIKSQLPGPPPVSNSYSLVGSLYSGKRRMATLSDRTGKQILIARGDSLAGWKTHRVGDKSVVFIQDGRQDTLRLSQVELE